MRIEEINGDEVIYRRRTGQYGEENYAFPTEMANNGVKIDFSRPIMERYSVKMVSNGFCEMCVPIV